ncbi:hypothetical protein H0Z09_05530 [Pseudomonas sp. SWRI18]|uniref:hypothetical protein n=1 Tax=Pseudomonas sp. SWRI18 TaxID=2753888 RepID=UPI00164788C9|nr:hypothetical protein [Pseudomonas sp. SWRI18]MBC3300572.1 hypothetical protein [Pseudomonas sp. SWRI18]
MLSITGNTSPVYPSMDQTPMDEKDKKKKKKGEEEEREDNTYMTDEEGAVYKRKGPEWRQVSGPTKKKFE